MEITSRQRARLKSIASNYDTIFQIGKNAISDELIKQLSDALEAIVLYRQNKDAKKRKIELDD